MNHPNPHTRSAGALRELADEIEQNGYGPDISHKINAALSCGSGFDAGSLLNILLTGVEHILAVGTIELDDGDGPYTRGYAQAIEDIRRDALALLASRIPNP